MQDRDTLLYMIKAVVPTDIFKYHCRAFRYMVEHYQDTAIQFEMLAFQKTACTAGRWTQGMFSVSEQHVLGIQGSYRLGFLPKAGDMHCPPEMSLQALKAVEDTEGIRG